MTTHPDLIINSAGRIELKPTEEDIIFYVPFNNDLHAEVSEGDSLPLIGLGTGRVGDTDTEFYSELNGPGNGPGASYEERIGGDTLLVYKKENFVEITNRGSVTLCAARDDWANSEERTIFEFANTSIITSTGDTIKDSNDLSGDSGKIKISFIGDSNGDTIYYLRFYSDDGSSAQGDSFRVTGNIGDTLGLSHQNILIPSLRASGNFITKRCFDFKWDRTSYQFYINTRLIGFGSLSTPRGAYGSFIYHFPRNTFISDITIRKNNIVREPSFIAQDFSIYPRELIHIDIPFGNGFEKDKVKLEVFTGDSNRGDSNIRLGDSAVRFLLKSGDTFFKSINMVWSSFDTDEGIIDPEAYPLEMTADVLKSNIERFPFKPSKQIFLRVFFRSIDGKKLVYLNKLKLIKLPTSRAIDYSEVYTYIRTKLGEPTIPVELTNQQLQSCIDDTIYYYNRYRNNKVEMEKYLLEGSFADGWNLPDEVKEEDILDVIIKPSIPFGFYRGRSGLLNNLYLQYIFSSGGGNLSSNIADYRITMSAIKDYAILLGSQPKWEIIGNKIKIWPDPPAGSELGIRYLSNVIPDDVVKDNFFRDLALAEAKILLGTIRSTFPGGVPGGFDNIQLNGESLLQEGKVEKERAIQRMIKAQEPLFLNFF